MYNERVVAVLAKSRVRFEAKLGNVITLEEAIKLEKEKVDKLKASDNYRY
jgi:hypothetical protein